MAGMMGLVIDLVAEEIGVVNFWGSSVRFTRSFYPC